MSSTQYTKKIALIDCNSFYVSCERLFNPKIRKKPVVVLSNNDGCIISRSNEAKTLGIKMGEPYFKAKDIIVKNNVQVFSSNYSLYGDISRRVMRTLKRFNSEIEVYSIDEAFLDLSNFDTRLSFNDQTVLFPESTIFSNLIYCDISNSNLSSANFGILKQNHRIRRGISARMDPKPV